MASRLKKVELEVKARDQRLCKCCDSLSIEDIRHFLLECRAYDDIRRKYLQYFQQPSLAALLNMKQAHMVGIILSEMQSKRKAILSDRLQLKQKQ